MGLSPSLAREQLGSPSVADYDESLSVRSIEVGFCCCWSLSAAGKLTVDAFLDRWLYDPSLSVSIPSEDADERINPSAETR